MKVLDGCSINNRYWVFPAAATNVEYTLTVTDTDASVTRQYVNGNFWFFHAGASNVAYEVTVLDTISGVSGVYSNPLGVTPDAVLDTETGTYFPPTSVPIFNPWALLSVSLMPGGFGGLDRRKINAS